MPLMPTQEQILVSDCRSALLGPACAHTRQDDWRPWYLRPRERERAGAQQRRGRAAEKMREKPSILVIPWPGHPLLTSRQSRAHARRPRTCSRGRLPWTLAQPRPSHARVVCLGSALFPPAAMLMTLYSTFMKRNSVYMGVVLGGALVGQTVRGSALPPSEGWAGRGRARGMTHARRRAQGFCKGAAGGTLG